MDKEMPEMDGLVCTRTLRQRGWTVPIVGCTGNAMLDDQDSFLGAGANGVITKPMKSDSLHQMLRQLCLKPATNPRAT